MLSKTRERASGSSCELSNAGSQAAPRQIQAREAVSDAVQKAILDKYEQDSRITWNRLTQTRYNGFGQHILQEGKPYNVIPWTGRA